MVSFKIFIVPIVVFFICLPYLARKNPLLMFITLGSFGITVILTLLYPAYASLKDRKTYLYLQEQNFALWKKSQSHSLKDRWVARKAMDAIYMQDPSLAKRMKLANKIAFILLTVWSLSFLCILLSVFVSQAH